MSSDGPETLRPATELRCFVSSPCGLEVTVVPPEARVAVELRLPRMGIAGTSVWRSALHSQCNTPPQRTAMPAPSAAPAPTVELPGLAEAAVLAARLTTLWSCGFRIHGMTRYECIQLLRPTIVATGILGAIQDWLKLLLNSGGETAGAPPAPYALVPGSSLVETITEYDSVTCLPLTTTPSR